MKTLQCADLFCGAGGTSTGLLRAAADLGRRVDLLAVNHWNLAIDTHTANHPEVRHLCESLDHIDPVRVVPGGRLDLLCASPECTHHSRARGGKPRSDQSRASAWKLVDWCAKLHVDNLLVENVREFKDWGPLTKQGKPMKRKKGKTFEAFITALRSQFAHVEWRVLNCADYGDPTTRERLFVMARRSKPVVWPAPSHAGRWKAAREVIDWELKGNSIFTRKKPLSANTLRRIEAGLRKFGGESFVVKMFGTGNPVKSPNDPLPTLTFSRNRLYIAEPFLIHTNHAGGDRCHSVERPVPTVTGGHRGEMALIEPMVLGQQSCAAARPVSEPLPTVAAAGAIALVEPFLVKFYGTERGAESIHDPLDTVTARDRFGLAMPEVQLDGQTYLLDIRFRMLQPHELAAAMSFPADYAFAGNREARVKQIGNAVPVETARALCKELMR